MSETAKVIIKALTRDSVESLFDTLGAFGVSRPNNLEWDDDEGDLITFTAHWDSLTPMALSASLARVYMEHGFHDEIDPFICIPDGQNELATDYLANVIHRERLKETLSRQVKRTNVLARELIETKSVINDTNQLVGDMYLQHTLLLQAFIHTNNQIETLGGAKFDFSSVQIQKH